MTHAAWQRIWRSFVVGAATVVALSACENKPSAGQAAVDRARLCSEGGATLNTVTNECACAAASKWNGVRCEADQAPPPAPAESASGTGSAAAPASEVVAAGSDASGSATTSPEAPLAVDPEVRAACQAAKAKFDEKTGYCLCKRGDVLVGKKCVGLAGFASKDACARAVHPGKWTKKECWCPDGEIFSPNLGGCLAARPLGDVVGRRVCESTLNKGKWDARETRCNCPKDRVWVGARCLPQRELTSRQVCEGDFNRGQWDKAKKRCDCPEGKTWRDQRCRLLATTDPKTACESEANAGKWEAGVSRCLCPGKQKWDKKSLACR